MRQQTNHNGAGDNNQPESGNRWLHIAGYAALGGIIAGGLAAGAGALAYPYLVAYFTTKGFGVSSMISAGAFVASSGGTGGVAGGVAGGVISSRQQASNNNSAFSSDYDSDSEGTQLITSAAERLHRRRDTSNRQAGGRE